MGISEVRTLEFRKEPCCLTCAWKDPFTSQVTLKLCLLPSLMSLLQLIHFSSFQQQQLLPLTQPTQKVLIWKFGQGWSSNGMHTGDYSVLSVVPVSSVWKPNWGAQSPRLLKLCSAVGLWTTLLGKGGQGQQPQNLNLIHQHTLENTFSPCCAISLLTFGSVQDHWTYQNLISRQICLSFKNDSSLSWDLSEQALK